MDWRFALEADVLREIGRRIQRMRKNAGMSQQKLSEKIGISRYRISDIERGENFTLEVFIRILKIFDKLNGLDQLLEAETLSPKALFEQATR